MPESENDQDFILVALDGSRPSRAAASIAIQIAQHEHLAIHALYIVDPLLVVETKVNLEDELGYRPSEVITSDEAAKLLETQGDEALRWIEDLCRAAGVQVEAELIFGGIRDLLIPKAEEAQMLAIGRRGRTHRDEVGQLGSHFPTIAHHVHSPMLVGGDSTKEVKTILLAYDGKPSTQRALSWTYTLQQVLQSRVLVLSVVEDDAPARWPDEIKERIGESNLADYRFISSAGEPATEIMTTATKEEADLIVMGSYRHARLVEWLTGSTLDQVLRNTPLPVFVVDQR